MSSYRQIEVGQLQRFRAASGPTSLPTTEDGPANAFVMNIGPVTMTVPDSADLNSPRCSQRSNGPPSPPPDFLTLLALAETITKYKTRVKNMSTNGLKQSFRCCGGPVLFLVSVCMTLGSLFLWLDSGAGWIFIIAAALSLAVFSLLGARSGSGAEFESWRFIPRAR